MEKCALNQLQLPFIPLGSTYTLCTISHQLSGIEKTCDLVVEIRNYGKASFLVNRMYYIDKIHK